MSKFTPGPWKVIDYKDSMGVIGFRGTLGIPVAHINMAFKDEEQANAKLIAAAPDLLFAAKQALMALEEGYDAPKIREDLKAAISAAKNHDQQNHGHRRNESRKRAMSIYCLAADTTKSVWLKRWISASPKSRQCCLLRLSLCIPSRQMIW